MNTSPLRQSPQETLREIQAEKARRRLHDFVRYAWSTVDPSELHWNWHIEAVCLHLEAVTRQQLWRPGEPDPDGGRIQKLIINIPPGHCKSLIVSVFWPAWEWIEHPHLKSLFCSYALELAMRDSRKCRDLIESDWYQSSFRPDWTLKGDQNTAKAFATSKGGIRQCLSVGSGGTGFRGDKVVVDDPQDAKQAHSETIRKAANDWWMGSMQTRVNDPRKGVHLVIQQRLHQDDLTGSLLAKKGVGSEYDHLILPAEFDPSETKSTSIGWQDPRVEKNQLLFQNFFTKKVLDQFKLTLGSAAYAGQFNQRPSPADGTIFHKAWWKFWIPRGMTVPRHRFQVEDGSWIECGQEEIPESFDIHVNSWDCSFKATSDTDFVAGQAWARKGANAFLLDQTLARLNFPETLKAIVNLKTAYPKTSAIYIEDKANGPAVISTLTNKVPGIVPVEPDGGKEARAHAVTPFVEAGNVYLPHPFLAPWVDGLINETTLFPKGANDDQVDALTQALTRLLSNLGPPSESAYEPFSDLQAQMTYTPR